MMKPNVRRWVSGILVLFALAGLAGLARGTAEQAPIRSQPGQGIDDAQIQELRALLESGQLSEAGRQSIQGKLEMAERMAAERQERQAAPAAGPRVKVLPEAMRLAPDPKPAEPMLEGIFAGSEGLVRPSLATITNLWQGQYRGTVYQVFAGSLPERPEQGLLIVVQLEPDRPTGDQQVYLSPAGSGSLTILSVEEHSLLLEGALGQKLSFDLLTRSYQE